ncbi:MAG: class I SAM-dependent methyltransferase [Iamia sp.]
MTQNIYDDPEFFERYSLLPRSVGGLEQAPEWPTLRALLPEVAGRRVVDLGCGFGWFCRWAADAGASSVLGLDVSANMLARARDENAGPAITYRSVDLDQLELAPDSVDLAYSSLALHYLADLARLFGVLRRALSPGGAFVFSVEHPIFTAPSDPGFVPGDHGRLRWPVDRYLDEGPRTTDWLTEGVVKQHRTIATYVSLLHAAGFSLTALDEWGPTEQQITDNPTWQGARDRPSFLLIAAQA